MSFYHIVTLIKEG